MVRFINLNNKCNKFLILMLLIFIMSCSGQNEIIQNTAQQREVSYMKLSSSAFVDKGSIPKEFTCDDEDLSPPLVISDVPKNAKSLALIMDDPDAPIGTFVHWVVWNIPPETREIKKGGELEGIQGRTDFGRNGYGGPCPPSGTHRYFFKLYALDTILNLKQGSTKKDLENTMNKHIIEDTQLIGNYRRG
ncbi:MAG: YbhB/YbcL family Raf kinase inhibitor-like protein [Nanoarchaeota archaeon]